MKDMSRGINMAAMALQITFRLFPSFYPKSSALYIVAMSELGGVLNLVIILD